MNYRGVNKMIIIITITFIIITLIIGFTERFKKGIKYIIETVLMDIFIIISGLLMKNYISGTLWIILSIVCVFLMIINSLLNKIYSKKDKA